MRTGTLGNAPLDWSRRRSIVMAMPPMLPTCISRMAISGVLAATAGATSRPLESTANVVDGESSAALTSLTTHWASVAIRMCTGRTLLPSLWGCELLGQNHNGFHVMDVRGHLGCRGGRDSSKFLLSPSEEPVDAFFGAFGVFTQFCQESVCSCSVSDLLPSMHRVMVQ